MARQRDHGHAVRRPEGPLAAPFRRLRVMAQWCALFSCVPFAIVFVLALTAAR